MDELRHVQPGEPLSIEAGTWNRLVDAARQHEADPRRTSGPAPVDADGWRPAVVVRARNAAEATIPPHAILTPAAAVLSPVDFPLDARRRPVIDVATPASADDAIVIAFESIAYQALGKVVVSGVTVALVNITDTAHRYARPIPGDRTKLASATSGPAHLLVPPSDTGEQLVYVQLGAGAASADTGASGGCGWVAGLQQSDCLDARIISASGRCACAGTILDQAVKLTAVSATLWNSPAVTGDAGSGSGGIPGTLTICGVAYKVAFTKGDCFGPCLVLTSVVTEDPPCAGIVTECVPGALLGSTAVVALATLCPGEAFPATLTRVGDTPVWTGSAGGLTYTVQCVGGEWVGLRDDGGGGVPATYATVFSDAGSIELQFGWSDPECEGGLRTYSFTIDKVICDDDGGGGSGSGSGGEVLTAAAVRESCGPNHAIFAIGDPAVCTGPKGCGGPAGNVVRIKVSWVSSCVWDGPGWYCARDCGTDGVCAAVELVEGDQYDPTIEICDGPYESEEAANAACGPVAPVSPGNTCETAFEYEVGVTYSATTTPTQGHWFHANLPTGNYTITMTSSPGLNTNPPGANAGQTPSTLGCAGVSGTAGFNPNGVSAFYAGPPVGNDHYIHIWGGNSGSVPVNYTIRVDPA